MQDMSEKNKESSKKNVHTHYMGRGGYRALEKKLKKKKGKVEVVNGSTNKLIDISQMSDRTIKWLVGRSKEDEEGRFVLDSSAVGILEKAVAIFYILFKLKLNSL